MYCDDKQEQISSFIDGELSPRDQLELFKHLANCAGCQSFIDVLIRMRETEKKEEISFPAEIDEALLSRLDGVRTQTHAKSTKARVTNFAHTGHRITISFPVAITAAAAAIIIGFLLHGFFFRSPDAAAYPFNTRSEYPQPTAVIFYYSMPPLEVTGTGLIRANNENSQKIFK